MSMRIMMEGFHVRAANAQDQMIRHLVANYVGACRKRLSHDFNVIMMLKRSIMLLNYLPRQCEERRPTGKEGARVLYKGAFKADHTKKFHDFRYFPSDFVNIKFGYWMQRLGVW
ncbi:hypothetical protein RUND412_004525 [Rhizina undulata]